ncbi:sensor histidine kinase [Qipengyuania sediminis]|uniref:sensor histidine kinase n=1 Tax=Qipengyuania sediminis TaxID=1532023 RepID=UPI0010598F11|nr:CHASE3 domain-containing protein [Qipengyuania sediminis]
MSNPGAISGLRSARIVNVVLIALTALAMVAVVVLAIRTIEVERTQREQARRTSQILDKLRDINRAALNGETGQRGYMLSLDRRYLAPYYAGRDQIEPALRSLRALVEPNATPRQLALLDAIEVLSRAKFTELEQGVGLVAQGDMIEARRLVLTDEGQEAMERLRRSVREMEAIEQALLSQAQGDAARAEARVVPLLGGLLGLLAISLIASGRMIARGARAEVEAAQAPVLAEARDRADLLARELNHRVKNLFAVVLAIVKLSARDDPQAKPVTERIAQRIMALLKAHEVSQGELDRPTVSLATLIETTLAPYRSDNLVAEIAGPEVILEARAITPLGLVLHELTTNAVKYGGWSRPGGRIAVSWEAVEGGMVHLAWRESGTPIAAPPERQGFGTMLMTSSAKQLGGSIERRFEPGGIEIDLRFKPTG